MNGHGGAPGSNGTGNDGTDGRYKWIALSNTTLSMTMATIDASIVIIAMPAIFRGIKLDPLAPGNVSYLLWMIIGYLLVTAVAVVTLGRLGDMYGRVRIYNLGFVVFTLASIALSLDPLTGSSGALWLIGWRLVQALGGAMLMSNSAAILTDAFPAGKRGMALGVNQIAGISGQFVGLLLGGLLAAVDWRLVFWINVPIGIVGTIWSYKSLREIATTRRARIDWWGNVTFGLGATALLVAITYGIQPYGGHPTGWTNPWVLAGLFGGAALLVVFCLIETHIAEPMFQLGLFRIRAFAAGNLASLLGSIARGGLQFMLVLWLAGIWLPLHGYNFIDTPLWAGIYMLPLTAGFLIAGPISGTLSDKYGPRPFATAGLLVATCAFIGLIALPLVFPYWLFATIIFFNGVGSGLVRLAQHLRHHEQRARQPAGQRVRDAVHLPERRHVAVDRHLLLAPDRRAGQYPAARADPRADRPGRAAVRGHQGRPPAAGQHGVRRPARLQPRAAPAQALGRAQPAAGPQRGGADRPALLPHADQRPVPSRPGHRVHRGRDHVVHRGDGLAAARPPVLLRRRVGGRRAGAGPRRPAPPLLRRSQPPSTALTEPLRRPASPRIPRPRCQAPAAGLAPTSSAAGAAPAEPAEWWRAPATWPPPLLTAQRRRAGSQPFTRAKHAFTSYQHVPASLFSPLAAAGAGGMHPASKTTTAPWADVAAT